MYLMQASSSGTTTTSRLEKPKTLEEAAKKLNSGHFQSVLTNVKTLYPDNAILWFKDAASFFNVNLTLDKKSGGSGSAPDSSFNDSPLNLLTKQCRQMLTSLVETTPNSVLESVYGNMLANLAHDMSKGHESVHGYLLILQALGEATPALCMSNAQRSQELLKSYRNRAQIGLALMWALGQGGKKNLSVGLQGKLSLLYYAVNVTTWD